MKTDNNGTVLYNRSELQAVFSQLQPREEYSLLHFNVKKFEASALSVGRNHLSS